MSNWSPFKSYFIESWRYVSELKVYQSWWRYTFCMCASSTIVVEQQLYLITCQPDCPFKVTSLRAEGMYQSWRYVSELKVYQYRFCMCASSTIVVEQQLYSIKCQTGRPLLKLLHWELKACSRVEGMYRSWWRYISTDCACVHLPPMWWNNYSTQWNVKLIAL